MGLVIVALSVALLSVSPSVLAQDHRGIHDQSYTSPTWGYHLRWDSDVWTVTDEASDQDGDRFWLTDTIGNVVGVAAQPGYGGDARPCLDDLHAAVQGLQGA